jgi:hypothetical protein
VTPLPRKVWATSLPGRVILTHESETAALRWLRDAAADWYATNPAERGEPTAVLHVDDRLGGGWRSETVNLAEFGAWQ